MILKNLFFNYLFVVLFFPFFIKIEFDFFQIYLKDLLIFFFIFFLIYFRKIFNEKEKIEIKKTLILLLLIYIFSIFFIYLKLFFGEQIVLEFNKIEFDFFISKFVDLFLRSVFVTFGAISLYFILCKILDQKKLFNILIYYYFACIIILLEFIFHIILKEFYYDNLIINKIYSLGIFRSIFLNGHIVTTIFLSVGFFVGIYLIKKLNYKSLKILNIFLILPIIYNFETRLTILAFFYIGLIYICLRYFNLKKIKLRYHFIIYTILISLVIIFSESNNLGIHQITFGNLIINTESLLDRVNINLISFFAFLNYPFGYGFEMFTAYLDFLYIPSIHLGNYNYKELYGSFITFHNFEYLNVHRDFSRSHGGILNILTSFGIFIFPLYYSLRNFNKMQKKFYYDFDLYILIKTSILFIILASLINYTFEIEILCILISVFFIKMRNLTNEN